MVGRNGQAGGKDQVPAGAVACLVAAIGLIAPAGVHAGEVVSATQNVSLAPNVLWEMVIGAVVLCAFLASVALWIQSALNHAARSRQNQEAYIGTALNSLNHGIVMTDPKMRIVYCNDRYFELYGLDRSDVKPGMTGPELFELRAARGQFDASANDFYHQASRPEGLVTELPNGS